MIYESCNICHILSDPTISYHIMLYYNIVYCITKAAAQSGGDVPAKPEGIKYYVPGPS